MIKQLLKPIFWFLASYAILALIHSVLLAYVFPESFSDPKIFKAYILFALYAVILIAYMLYLRKTDPVKAGWAYLAGGMFKMFLALFYLIPITNARPDNMKQVVVQIVAIYFLGLLIEVFILFKVLKTPEKA